MIVVQVFSSSLGNRWLCAITAQEAALLAVECPGMSNTQRKRTVTKPVSLVAPSLPWGLPSADWGSFEMDGNPVFLHL